MAYRRTKRSQEQLARMRFARDATKMARPVPDYPPAMPELRRRIIIHDFDFGERIHTLDLYRTNRTCWAQEIDAKSCCVRIKQEIAMMPVPTRFAPSAPTMAKQYSLCALRLAGGEMPGFEEIA